MPNEGEARVFKNFMAGDIAQLAVHRLFKRVGSTSQTEQFMGSIPIPAKTSAAQLVHQIKAECCVHLSMGVCRVKIPWSACIGFDEE